MSLVVEEGIDWSGMAALLPAALLAAAASASRSLASTSRPAGRYGSIPFLERVEAQTRWWTREEEDYCAADPDRFLVVAPGSSSISRSSRAADSNEGWIHISSHFSSTYWPGLIPPLGPQGLRSSRLRERHVRRHRPQLGQRVSTHNAAELTAVSSSSPAWRTPRMPSSASMALTSRASPSSLRSRL